MPHYRIDVNSDHTPHDIKVWLDEHVGPTLSIKNVDTGERHVFLAGVTTEAETPKLTQPSEVLQLINKIKAEAAPRLLTADNIATELNKLKIRTLRRANRWDGKKVQLFLDRYELSTVQANVEESSSAVTH